MAEEAEKKLFEVDPETVAMGLVLSDRPEWNYGVLAPFGRGYDRDKRFIAPPCLRKIVLGSGPYTTQQVKEGLAAFQEQGLGQNYVLGVAAEVVDLKNPRLIFDHHSLGIWERVEDEQGIDILAPIRKGGYIGEMGLAVSAVMRDKQKEN